MIRPERDVASLRREAGRNVACKEKRVYGNYLFNRFFAKIIWDWEMSILQVTIQYRVFEILHVKIILDRWTVYRKTNISNICIVLQHFSAHPKNVLSIRREDQRKLEYQLDINLVSISNGRYILNFFMGNRWKFSALGKNSNFRREVLPSKAIDVIEVRYKCRLFTSRKKNLEC